VSAQTAPSSANAPASDPSSAATSPFEPWLAKETIDMKFTQSNGKVYSTSTYPTKKFSRLYGYQCTAGDIPTAYAIEANGSLVMLLSPQFPGCDKFKYVFDVDKKIGEVFRQAKDGSWLKGESQVELIGYSPASKK
jgi:hypothetical protein